MPHHSNRYRPKNNGQISSLNIGVLTEQKGKIASGTKPWPLTYRYHKNNKATTNSTKTSFAKNVKKILELKVSHKQNKTKTHLCPTRQTIIFVQLDKQSSSSNSTNNHLCQTRQTIIFVQLDEQSSLSNPTNNHLCQIRRTIILVKFDKQFFRKVVKG